MGFSPKCKDALPILYLVNGYVSGGAAIATPRVTPDRKTQPVEQAPPARSLSQFPDRLTTMFRKTLNASLAKLTFTTDQTAPSSTPSPLFKVQELLGIENLPPILGAGDIILCFTFFPDLYDVSVVNEGEFFYKSRGGELEAVFQGLLERSRTSFLKEWKARADGAKSPPPTIDVTGRAEPDTLGVGTSLVSELSLKLKSGANKQTYFSFRGGVIEAGAILGVAANQVWTGIGATLVKGRKKFMKALQEGATKEEAFGPKAVASLKALDLGTYAGLYDTFLDAAGRGLAYTALHEFRHAAGLRGHPPDPSGMDQNVIELAGNPSFRRELSLLDSTISGIKEQYVSTWCKFFTAGRSRITAP